MHWALSYKADPRALPLANRHYNRQHPESPQFVPPGKALVLLTPKADALWISSWPKAEFVRHAWAGAWVCTLFRNESSVLSSTLIKEAVAATLFTWGGGAPDLGMVTFVDTTKVRKKRDWGRCYLKAGWHRAGTTKGGLVALQLSAKDFPAPEAPRARGGELPLFNFSETGP